MSMTDAMSQQVVGAGTTAFRVRPLGMTMDKMIAKYVGLRDKKAALAKQHAEQLAPFNQTLEILEAWMLEDLQASGSESMRTENGTAYKSKRTSATVEEWAAVLKFIQDNNAWDLLERRVSKTAVQAVIDDTQQPVPGVKVTTEVTVNVRRA